MRPRRSAPARFYVFRRIILPTVLPALLTGFTMAFARAVGEYGSVIFIAGNLPMKTEITPLLIVIKLEQFDYAGAAALGLRDAGASPSSCCCRSTCCRPGAGGGIVAGGALMAGTAARQQLQRDRQRARAATPGVHALVRWRVHHGCRSLFLAALLFAPLATVFATALEKGSSCTCDSFADSDTLAAIRLTLITAAIVVPVNTVFGIAAAWAIAKFEFRGKSFLITLIDLPLAVSPVISGLIYVLLFGMQGWFGAVAAGARHQHHLRAAGHRARDHVRDLPLRRARADPAHAAARQRRGGGGHHARRRRLDDVLPRHAAEDPLGPAVRRDPVQRARDGRVRRGVGRLAATSAALTNTMPLHIEILYNEYNFVGAFAVASLLTLLAVVTLVIKTLVEWRTGYQRH